MINDEEAKGRRRGEVRGIHLEAKKSAGMLPTAPWVVKADLLETVIQDRAGARMVQAEGSTGWNRMRIAHQVYILERVDYYGQLPLRMSSHTCF